MDIGLNRSLMDIYSSMYDKEGSRHWWPAENDFEMIVGAILTQFVSWKNVTLAIENLKRENILSIDGICASNMEALGELVRCTRFYKQKAKKLKVFCQHVKSEYEGSLDKMFENDLYDLRRELLFLYGIGQETADCIILYAARKPIFVVDSYTRRVFGRLGYFKENESYESMQRFFMDNLEHNTELFNEYHAQIDGVGSKYCLGKNPRCPECPLSKICKI